MVLVLLGDRDDEAEVGTHHTVQSTAVPLLDLLGELYLLVYGQ